jgi:hypothetical protein
LPALIIERSNSGTVTFDKKAGSNILISVKNSVINIDKPQSVKDINIGEIPTEISVLDKNRFEKDTYRVEDIASLTSTNLVWSTPKK